MQNFRQYLASTVSGVKNGEFGPSQDGPKKLRIVMGNTSCDVDSAIGALVLAYYLTKKSDGQETWVPVINAPKKDFFCNLEIIQHLKDCGIT